MTEEPAPGRTALQWSPEARADLRAIDREPAMQVLYCVDRYLTEHIGDVKKLRPPLFPQKIQRRVREEYFRADAAGADGAAATCLARKRARTGECDRYRGDYRGWRFHRSCGLA